MHQDRGLCLANWRLVYNAVCLPVLSYGCQLWWPSPKCKRLLNMLQVVQNEGVKVLTGAFWTAPRASLHAFVRVLPFHIFVDKLISRSAVRLYNQPRSSQLLHRLGPGWRQPLPVDLPLPHFQVGLALRVQKSGPTALEALASRVPIDGPRVDSTAAPPPWVVPVWQPRTSYMGVTPSAARRVRVDWVRGLHTSAHRLNHAIVHVSAAVGSAGRLGPTRHVPVAAGALTFAHQGTALTQAFKLGSRLTEFDAHTHALACTVDWLLSRFAHTLPPPVVYVVSSNDSAVRAVMDPRSVGSRKPALQFHRSLTTFFQTHGQTKLVFVWSPTDRTLGPRQRVRAAVVAQANAARVRVKSNGIGQQDRLG